MSIRTLILVLIFALAGCATQQPERKQVPQTQLLEKFEYVEVTPVDVPEPFSTDLGTYTDDNGNTWALIDPNELYKIEQAYQSSEQNAELVKQSNEIMRLLVQRGNLMIQLAKLEEYRASKMEILLDDERENAKEQQLRSDIENITLKILTALALAAAL